MIPKKPFYKKAWFWVVLVLVLGGIGSALGDDEPKKVPEPDQSDSGNSKEETPKEETPKEESKDFAVGDLIEGKGYTFKINSVREQEPTDFVKPNEGEKLFVLDITLENKSDEEMAVSSLMSFQLKDSDGRSKDYILNIEQDGQLDGSVLAGEKMSGEITYSVAADGDLYMYYTNEVFTGKPLKVKVR